MNAPVIIPPRPAITRKDRAFVLAKHHNRCSYPGCEVNEALEIDHIIARELTGKDDVSNYAPLCRFHHAQKTARDRKLIARAHRRERKANPETRKQSLRPLQSRGFNTSLTKGFDGKVRSRKSPINPE